METTKPKGYWHHFWSNADRPTMRYDLLGITPTRGQWKWSKVRADKAVQNYKKFMKKSSNTEIVYYPKIWLDLH